MKKINFLISEIRRNDNLEVSKNCGGVTIINKGETILLINGVELFPGTSTSSGESLTFNCDFNETYAGRLQVEFLSLAGKKDRVIMIQKIRL